MNEENGLRGGNKYAELAKLNNENHIAAIESDAGGFVPRGFGIGPTIDQKKDASQAEKLLADNQYNKIASWLPLFLPYNLHKFARGGGGADIGPLAKFGTVLIGLDPDGQRYFKYHHTSIDTFDKVSQRELELGAASMSALLYLLSEYGI
jgi:carboxypeptidase Q